MKIICRSHRFADQIVPNHLLVGVQGALRDLSFIVRRNSSRELRSAILDRLRRSGWSDTVRLRARRGLTITSMSGQTGLCLQTGNMARFYADLIKLQAQFAEGKITSAIYILPKRGAARLLGSNIANYERFTAELEMFQEVITVPIFVIGFEQALDQEER